MRAAANNKRVIIIALVVLMVVVFGSVALALLAHLFEIVAVVLRFFARILDFFGFSRGLRGAA